MTLWVALITEIYIDQLVQNNGRVHELKNVNYGPLGPSLANVFLAYHEQNRLDKCTLE